MLLDRIDIDAHGPLHRVELGPFAEHLNVVCGPEGSGKTAIARFVRDSLIDRDYPLGMMSSSTGRIVWADRNGKVHCRRERDGSVTGRRTAEFESRGDGQDHFGDLEHSWMGGTASSDASRAMDSLRLPEAIVDGVMTDTAITSVARVVSACVRCGLDCHETYRSLPLAESSMDFGRGPDSISDGNPDINADRNRSVRRQLADIEAELARCTPAEDHAALVARRNELASRLARNKSRGRDVGSDRNRLSDWQSRLSQLHEQTRHLQTRQSALRRSIAEFEDERHQHGPVISPVSLQHGEHQAVGMNQQIRRQLDELDAQMIRWRRTLSEVRGLRNAVELHQHDVGEYHGMPIDHTMPRRRRLDGFLHAVDRYDPARSWDHLYPDPYRPQSRVDDIELRFDFATRQIDWLLDRYAAGSEIDLGWYRSNLDSVDRGGSLVDTLRMIRRELCQLQSLTSGSIRSAVPEDSISREIGGLRRCERWLVSAIDRLIRHRENTSRGLFTTSRYAAPHKSLETTNDHLRNEHQRDSRVAELDRVSLELDQCLHEAAKIRRRIRSQPAVDNGYRDWAGEDASGRHRKDWIDREALSAELRRIDDRLASFSRSHWLRARRQRLIEQLRGTGQSESTGSPLSVAASHWLIRLSAGSLRRIKWPHHRFRDLEERQMSNIDSHLHEGIYRHTGVSIDGRDEVDCPAADRALAVLAVRLAAGELLARTGRMVPLILETDRELIPEFSGQAVADRSDQYGASPLAYDPTNGHNNHAIVAALTNYAREGRQLVLLTSSHSIADQLTRCGGKRFDLFAEPIVHAHRPQWQSHYESERYVGPHPHTYGRVDADEITSKAEAGCTSRRAPPPSVDINRDLDLAWRETYRLDDAPSRGRHRRTVRTDWAIDGAMYRDGYYSADAYTTDTGASRDDAYGHAVYQNTRGHRQQSRPQHPERAARRSPFFLTVDSSIDQAPSIDAVAAARLRGLNVTHINHLMQQDANRLSDSLGLASVDAATIRRWQAECRLVCRVPQLRGFDARILVGCGVHDPARLAATHPLDLLHQVESFLATEQGQQILLSGSSHELSRITSWMAAAHSHGLVTARFGSVKDRRKHARRSISSRDSIGSDRNVYEVDDEKRNRRTGKPGRGLNGIGAGYGQRSAGGDPPIGGGNDSGSGSGNGRSRTGRSDRPRRRRGHRGAVSSNRGVVRLSRERSHRHEAPEREPAAERAARADREPRQKRSEIDSEQELRFFLERGSAVVDAPSIGARVAEKLNGFGIDTVDDLLRADVEALASELDHPGIDANSVREWQQQATLVCRVPMLRGHDAQLLVAADVVSPEELAAYDAEELLGLIDPISRSRKGNRILRGGKRPDLEEIKDWIRYAQHTRELVAA